MTPAAALMLAAAASASNPGEVPSRGPALAEARVTAQILPAAIVRQAGGLERDRKDMPQHRLTRRGEKILVEFE
jgi:hypothetical protein